VLITCCPSISRAVVVVLVCVLVVINVKKKIKNVKERVFYPQNKKNVCKRDKKRYPIFYLRLI